ncbi:aspartic peptidase domain-containing protein [Amanita rubescens]|nr:aspartic peptidase domain-containing protein [Amanita rubescens]
MFPGPKALLNGLLLAPFLAINPASAVVTIRLNRHLNTASALSILKFDQARATFLATGVSSWDEPEPIVNEAEYYTADVGIGTPPTYYSLLVDTGSSNTWVGANKTYVETLSSVKTNQTVAVKYGSGNFTGVEYIDTVTLGEMVIHNQSIGVATSDHGFPDIDGILGVGPIDLTLRSLSPDNTTTIPTVTDNAFSQGLIPAHEIGISFEPTTSAMTRNGELTWGGVDPSKFIGSLHYAPITSTLQAGRFWGVNQTITYGSMTIMSNSAGIVDTGTTLVLLATDAYQRYANATGGTYNSTVGLLKISTDQYEALCPLNFDINGKTFTLTPNAQIWPRSLNNLIGGDRNDIFLIVQDLGSASKLFSFVNGYTFLERHYTVYDSAKRQVGFANTPFTDATTN